MSEKPESSRSDLFQKWEDLIKQARSGKTECYEMFLTELCDYLKSRLKRKIFNHSEVDDVVQEVLMAVHRSLPTFEQGRALGPWLSAIIQYKCIDYIRKNEKSYKLLKELAASQILEESSSGNLDRSDVNRALNELGEGQRAVVELTKILGLSIDEAADELNISPSNIKVMTHRSLKKMRNFFLKGSLK